MKMKVWLLNNLVIVLLLLVTVLVVVGSILNEHNHKYSRSKNTSCSHGILVLNEPDSHQCCASTHYENTWICSASFDYINSVISSKWAFFIPLLPLLANVVFAHGWRSSAWLRRLGAYLALFLLRTVVLYLIPYHIQEWVQSSGSQSIVECWCKEFVSATKCEMHFDFSDHIVLNVVQYMLPCILEVHYSLCSILGLVSPSSSNNKYEGIDNTVDSRRKGTADSGVTKNTTSTSTSNSNNNSTNSHSDAVQSNFGTVVLSALRRPRAEHISIAVSLILLVVSARSLLLTGMFFHTYLENAVGLLIAVAVAGLPLYSNNVVSLWVTRVLR